MRHCVLGKDTLGLFFIGSQAVWPLWGPNLTKGLRTESKKGCSALVWLDRRRMPCSQEKTFGVMSRFLCCRTFIRILSTAPDTFSLRKVWSVLFPAVHLTTTLCILVISPTLSVNLRGQDLLKEQTTGWINFKQHVRNYYVQYLSRIIEQ